jgi:hypothetical protein
VRETKNNPTKNWQHPERLRKQNLSEDSLEFLILQVSKQNFKNNKPQTDVFQAHAQASDSEYETTPLEDYTQYLKIWKGKLLAQSKITGTNDQLTLEEKMLFFGKKLSNIRYFETLFDIENSDKKAAETSFFTLLGHLFGNEKVDEKEKLLFCDFLENSNYSGSKIKSYFSCIDIRELILEKPSKRQKLGDNSQQKQKSKESSRKIIPLNQNLFDRTIDGLKQYELDVPGDGTCLFYAVTLAYLLPVVEKPEEFKERFVKLFGEGVKDSSNNNRELLLKYNGIREFISDNTGVFEVLVNNNFRERVVHLMTEQKEEFSSFIPSDEEIDDRLARMKDPSKKTHGDSPEIEAMSRLLGVRITVYERKKAQLENYEISPVVDGDHGESYEDRLYVVHAITPEKMDIMKAYPETDKNNNHYRFLVKQEIIQNLRDFDQNTPPEKELLKAMQEKMRVKDTEESPPSTTSAVLRKGLENINISQLIQTHASFALGQAIDDGGCFFDALAQALNIIQRRNQHTEKSLRMNCHQYYLEHEIEVNHWNKKDYGGLDTDQEYFMVQYTKTELDQNFHGRTPTWGRPDIEGKILCRVLEIETIIVLEVIENPETQQQIPSFTKITAQDIKSLDEEDANILIKSQEFPILVNAQGQLHFVPLLTNPALTVSTSLTRKRLDPGQSSARPISPSFDRLRQTSPESEVGAVKQKNKAFGGMSTGEE